MSALKKIFGGGDARDDEIMYRTEGQSAATGGTGETTGGSTATENVDREIQSSRDIGTGAQDNPGFISKATDTSNVESQFANTSSTTSSSNPPTTYTRESNPPVTYAQDSNTERNTALAGAGAAGAAGTGAVVYASDRVGGGSGQDDISKATYTERSYPLASDSTRQPTTTESSVAQYPTGYSRDTNAPGAIGGTAPVTSDSSVAQYPTGYSRDPDAPGAVGDTPGHVPGEFPTEERLDPVSNPGVTSTSTDRGYGQDAAIAGGATAAAGAAGYGAYSATDSRSTGLDPVSNPGVSSTSAGRSYGGDDSRFDPVSNRDVTSTSTDSSYGRDAAIAGGATGAAGAAGAGAYYASDTRGTESQRTTTDTRHETGIASIIDPRAQGTDERKVNETHYGRDAAAAGAVTGIGAGAGYAATRDNTDAYRAAGTDERKVQETETHYGRDAAAAGAVTGVGAGTVSESGEKKQGFFSKAFHGPRKDEEVSIGDSNPSNEVQRGGESTSMGSERTSGLPHDDSGLITLQREGSDPTAPALVIREKPGGGVETVPRE